MPGFVVSMRKHGCGIGPALIYNAFMPGLRVAPGGARGRDATRPDLTTLGRVMGGGLPLGALGGRRDIMDKLAPLGPVYQAGTLSGNPLAVAAGLATLTLVVQPRLLERIEATTRSLAEGLVAEARKAGVIFSSQS